LGKISGGQNAQARNEVHFFSRIDQGMEIRVGPVVGEIVEG